MTAFPGDVCVATMAWARDSGEERILRASLAALHGTGLPMTVADKGDNVAFTQFLGGLRGVSVIPSPAGSLVAQVQASLRAAGSAGTRFVLYTEPDKEDFFAARLASFFDRAPRHPRVGVVLAARTRASFATFPAIQQYTEGVINHLMGEVTGQPGDYSYGPMLLTRDLLPEVTALNPDVGWGWRHFAVCRAMRMALTVHLIEDDHPCPVEQRLDDERERTHRLRQLAQNISGLLRGTATD
ncbi:MAG TPA: hypothetical protein VE379_12115 [Vicinamibacterales bacterium]|nr:hypothetical protein [Vicinamibacterales bacterium]